MPATSSFESFTQEAHLWVNEVADELGLDDKRVAQHVLRAVLHALRDRLPLELVAHLSSQLPMLIRGMYFENWNPHARPAHHHRLDDFAEALDRELYGFEAVIDVRDATRAAFAVIGAHVSLGEWRKIAGALPRELAELWEDSGA